MRAAVALLLAAGLAAQEQIERIDGSRQAWQLEAIRNDELVGRPAAGAPPERIPLEQVVAIRFSADGRELPDAEGELRLRAGAVLAGRVTGGAERSLRFRPSFGAAELSVPLRWIRSVRFRRGDVPGFDAALAQPPAGDVLFADSGGQVRRLSVEVEGCADGQLTVRFQGATQQLPFERIFGIVFGESSGVAEMPTGRPLVTVDLQGGPALTGAIHSLDAGELELELAPGVTLPIPRAHLRALRIRSDAVAYLSDLEPQVEQTPAFDRRWPWLRDAAHAGGAIRIGGVEHPRGLALIPRMQLRFTLDGRYDWFGAVAGLEDRAGPHAHAILRVRGDDRVLFDSGPIEHGRAAQELRLDVRGVRQLVLEADFGERFDLGDHCVFASARVWRETRK